MRHYAQLEEQRIRAQAHVREWSRAKLIDSSQRAQLEAEVRVDVRRTNDFLRAGLALFAAIIVYSSVLLVMEAFGLKDRLEIAAVTAVAALVCIGLAEVLAGHFRFYRFGVEEVLGVSSVILLCISAGELVPESFVTSAVVALLVGAAGGFGLYRRFGFVYAAFGSMVCLAAIPFQLELSIATQHVLAAAVLALVFFITRAKRLADGDEYPGDEYGQLQAVAFGGLYATLNLKLSWDLDAGAFYWFTYVMTWVLPVAGLRWAIREKDRQLLDVSLVMALVTMLTNKPYLGWIRRTWDPILLGILLMAVSIALRRWLSKGHGGGRDGFTADRVLTRDSAALTLLGAASAAFQPAGSLPGGLRTPQTDATGPRDFGGGRSGGAGGGGAY